MKIILLGPQRLRPTLATVVGDQGIRGPIAAVTAGWQEREDEDHELRDHLGGRTLNLQLYQRTEKILKDDPDLFSGYRDRQNRLKELRKLYNRRLSHLMAAARELLQQPSNSRDVQAEVVGAIDDVRRLDRHHLSRVSEVHREFEDAYRVSERASVRRQKQQIAAIISGCSVLAIAGGHVAVLLNRIRLFDLLELLEEQPIIAWSAGAMVLGSQIVVFHDSPPQGAGHAEVFESGMGVFSDVLPLPHAKRRLLLSDTARVGLMSRRFAPLTCVPLDEGAELIRSNGRWTPRSPTNRLTVEGDLLPLNEPWSARGGVASI